MHLQARLKVPNVVFVTCHRSLAEALSALGAVGGFALWAVGTRTLRYRSPPRPGAGAVAGEECVDHARITCGVIDGAAIFTTGIAQQATSADGETTQAIYPAAIASDASRVGTASCSCRIAN